MTNKEFLPGEDWLYYKIYVDEVLSDLVLTKRISKIVKSANRIKIIDSWFYIRYKDPDSHIRVRFHLVDNSRIHQLLSIINRNLVPLVKSGSIQRVVIDMYERELERYGYEKIVFFEHLFSVDSQNVVSFLDSNPSEMEKIIEAICKSYYFIDKFLNGYSNKMQFVKEMSVSYMKEHHIDKPVNLNKKYRCVKSQLLEVFQSRQSDLNAEFKDVIDELRFPKFQTSFLSSIIHMSINRLFNSNQRAYELIVYLYLEKLLQNLKQINHFAN